MELYLDTANVAEVERLARIYPLAAEKLSAMRPTGRIFVFSSHQIMPGNERQIALQSTFLATKTAFYIAMRPVYPRKIEKFYDFINGHKLSIIH